jgi:urea transport system substrate-binding protein
MTDDARVEELLLAWEESRASGEPLLPQDLCRDCPKLLDRVQRRIRDLRAISSVLDLAAFREESAAGDASTLTPDTPAGANRDETRPPRRPTGDVLSLPGYKILGELGRGGMGVVYQAWQLGLERLVALKVILAGKHAAPSELDRFFAEARLIARLRHPNIVQIFDLGDHEGRPYYAMEFLEAGSLDQVLHQHRLSPRRAAELIETLARAVHYAHQQGIIHRDLKPGNILLTAIRVPAEGEVELGTPKIGDFGLARQLGRIDRVTRPGTVLGTPAYMAPEQAARTDRQVGPATDIYGLGVLLYQVLTGAPPFQADTDWETLQAVVHQPPQPPSQIRADCPPALEEICLRCLQKSPSDRYPSAEALAVDLHHFKAGEPISPPPRLPPRRISRRTWLATSGAAALSLTAGAYFFFGRQLFPKGPPIRIGLLHAGPGPLVISGDAILDSERLAVSELNDSGGLLGREIEAVMLEDPDRQLLVTEQAERLIVDEKVSVLIGGSTSATHKLVKEVVEKHDNLLLYPMEFEGLEESDNIVYLGAIPNQLMFPAIKTWLLEQQTRGRFFVVASDSLLPRACAEIIRGFIPTLAGAEIVGAEFLPKGSPTVSRIVKEIRDAKPQALLNLIHGDDSVTLMKEMRAADLTPERLPTVSFFFTEQEMRSLKRAEMTGDYLVSSYFECLPGEENAGYLKLLQDQYGPQRLAFDDTETGYSAVHLWAHAVRAARSDDPREVRRVIGQQNYSGPGGPIMIDSATGYAHKNCRVGRIKADGSIEIEWSSESPIAPVPFPGPRGKQDWKDWLHALYQKWGNQWTNPAKD